jgi:hypothetical protein
MCRFPFLATFIDKLDETNSSQPICPHSRCEFAVVPFNHCSTIAHVFAQCVNVSTTLQQRQRGVGVSQRIEGSRLSRTIQQQATISHQSAECPTKLCGWCPSLKLNSKCGTRSVNVVSNDIWQMAFCRACSLRKTSTALCLAMSQRPPVLPSTHTRRYRTPSFVCHSKSRHLMPIASVPCRIPVVCLTQLPSAKR